MLSKEEKNLEIPIGFSVHERNQRLMEKLIADGLVVVPVLQQSADPKIRHIHHLKVSASIGLILNNE